jgi:hypothetical protein
MVLPPQHEDFSPPAAARQPPHSSRPLRELRPAAALGG